MLRHPTVALAFEFAFEFAQRFANCARKSPAASEAETEVLPLPFCWHRRCIFGTFRFPFVSVL